VTVVVDASAALTWCFKDEARPDLDRLLYRIRDEGGHAPSLWRLEIANILVVAVRRGRLSEDRFARELPALLALPIDLDRRCSGDGIADVVELARRHRLTVYDAAYLELAFRLDLPLASLDGDLRDAAARTGVQLIPDSV